MSATHATQSTAPRSPVLCMALELSLATWKLAFTAGSVQKPRTRSVSAGVISAELAGILECLGSSAESWWARMAVHVVCSRLGRQTAV